MEDSFKKILNTMVEEIAQHEKPFYRELWRGERDFLQLPLARRNYFAQSPLTDRSYKPGGFVKIAGDGESNFLVEWNPKDIGGESFGVKSQRPGVCFVNSHEALEKALWCYEQDSVPLLAESAPLVLFRSIEKYAADSLIADEQSLKVLTPYIYSRPKSYLKAISVVGSSFATQEFESYAPFAKEVRLVLALPEVGSFAVAQLSPVAKFVPLLGCYIEDIEGTIVLTKLHGPVTPIIRYNTGIQLGERYPDGFSLR